MVCRSMRRVILLLLLGVLSGGMTGCMRTAAYQPNTQRVAELGLPQAPQQRLEEVLLRSVNPPISAVETTDAFIRVDLRNTTYQVRVFFQDIRRVEVFTNHLVVLRGAEDHLLFRPLFANAQDATAFADLILSLQAR
jgi:hypothetical protein